MTITTQSATTALIQPYLFFDGRFEEAIAFYRTALAAAELLMLMRFKDSRHAPPPGMIPPGWESIRRRLNGHRARAAGGRRHANALMRAAWLK